MSTTNLFVGYEAIRFFIAILCLVFKMHLAYDCRVKEFLRDTMIIRFFCSFVYFALDYGCCAVIAWICGQFGIVAASNLAYAVITILISLIFTKLG